jgi:hypothetical protein
VKWRKFKGDSSDEQVINIEVQMGFIVKDKTGAFIRNLYKRISILVITDIQVVVKVQQKRKGLGHYFLGT